MRGGRESERENKRACEKERERGCNKTTESFRVSPLLEKKGSRKKRWPEFGLWTGSKADTAEGRQYLATGPPPESGVSVATVGGRAMLWLTSCGGWWWWWEVEQGAAGREVLFEGGDRGGRGERQKWREGWQGLFACKLVMGRRPLSQSGRRRRGKEQEEEQEEQAMVRRHIRWGTRTSMHAWIELFMGNLVIWSKRVQFRSKPHIRCSRVPSIQLCLCHLFFFFSDSLRKRQRER